MTWRSFGRDGNDELKHRIKIYLNGEMPCGVEIKVYVEAEVESGAVSFRLTRHVMEESDKDLKSDRPW